MNTGDREKANVWSPALGIVVLMKRSPQGEAMHGELAELRQKCLQCHMQTVPHVLR